MQWGCVHPLVLKRGSRYLKRKQPSSGSLSEALSVVLMSSPNWLGKLALKCRMSAATRRSSSAGLLSASTELGEVLRKKPALQIGALRQHEQAAAGAPKEREGCSRRSTKGNGRERDLARGRVWVRVLPKSAVRGNLDTASFRRRRGLFDGDWGQLQGVLGGHSLSPRNMEYLVSTPKMRLVSSSASCER